MRVATIMKGLGQAALVLGLVMPASGRGEDQVHPLLSIEIGELLDATTEEMVESFALLMQERASLGESARESLATIRQARAASGPGANINTPTAHAYRQAVREVEKALDAHPQVVAFQEQIDALQAERVEIAKEQEVVLEAWHTERLERYTLFNAAVRQAMDTYLEKRQDLLSRAGASSARNLSGSFADEYQELFSARTNALVFARDTMARVSDPETIRQSREADGSQAVFDAANERYGDLDEAQDGLRSQMLALRARLRTSDPEIARLVAHAQAASQAHLVAVASAEPVQSAHAFVETVHEVRSEIDRRARHLRRAILAEEPEREPELEKWADVGGLRLATEEFWHLSE